ncbi:MAG: SRPBCC family protein [Rubrobacteraceae bacterium]
MNHPVRANYLIRGVDREKVFDALLDVPSFTEWGYGLRRARVLDLGGLSDTAEVTPGSIFEFVLSAAGFTHRVESTVTRVEAPHRLEWRYTGGAVGTGGWLLEEEGPLVRMTLYTDYEVNPAWLNRIAHRPFFRELTESLLRRSMRRFEERLTDVRLP